MRLATMCAPAVLWALVVPASGTMISLDTFNRADSPSMGASWTEQMLDFRIASNQARAINNGLMTFVGAGGLSPDDAIGVEALHSGQAQNQYIALVLRYASLANNVFVKLQDNGGTGTFNRLYFYYGNDGGGWAGMTGGSPFIAITPTSHARIRAAVNGSTVLVQLDSNNDGTWDHTYSRGGLPLGALGTGIGLGGYGDSVVDNFRGYVGETLPEPATALMVALGGVMAFRRRS